MCEKGGVQMGRGGLWVSSSAWCEKGVMRKLCKNALRVFREIEERACVHCFWLAKPLGVRGIWYDSGRRLVFSLCSKHSLFCGLSYPINLLVLKKSQLPLAFKNWR